MKIKIEKGCAGGRVKAPPSKSMAHRYLICAALARGRSVIRGMSDCEDVRATVDCLAALGVPISAEGDRVTVDGIDVRRAVPRGVLDCRESGSTMRFLIPLCLMCEKNTMLTGSGKLLSRPMSVYGELAKERGFIFLQDEGSVMVRGPLGGGDFRVAGNISSQFISGLLFALPLAECDSTITVTPPIESRSYIELTLQALREFGVSAYWQDDHTLFVKGGQSYTPTETEVEGDYSGAAFFDALRVLGSDVTVEGLREDSLQGDRAYSHYYDMLCKGTPTIHIGDCPDLGPILFALAAAKYGGVFTGTSRLRLKESDRAAAMASELCKFGASVAVHDDDVVVYPTDFHPPKGVLCGHNDHRIVMSLAVLLTATGGEIEGAEAVSKSLPGFFDDMSALGVTLTREGGD